MDKLNLIKNIRAFDYNEIKKGEELVKVFNNVEFYGNSKLVSSALLRLYQFLNLERNYDLVYSDTILKSYYFRGNYFILEYNDKSVRDKDYNFFKKNFELIDYKAVFDKNGNQVPYADCYFNNDGKFYILVEAYGKLKETEEKIDGLYKGVILNPSIYSL